MAVTAFLYGSFFSKLANKLIDLDSDTFKVALATSSYTPDQDTHDEFADITNEVSGTGYTAGGETLTTPAFTYTGATNVFKWDADDVSWAASTITARYAIIYDDTPAGDPLVGYVDFGEDVTSTNGTFSITWAAGGIFTITLG